MNKINVAIVGFGLSGKVFHTSLIKACPDYEVTKVFTSRKDELSISLPNAKAVSELNDIYQDDEIDLVILCGPNDTHYPQAKDALLAGKHVVVEKPFVVNSKEGQELIDLAKDKNLLLTVFHNRRWDCDFLTVKKLITEGKLGEIMQFESHFDRWRPNQSTTKKWKERPGEGTGILYDIGVHLIDQCLELFGKPDEVIADLGEQKGNAGVIDYFHLILKYKEMRAILHSSSYALANQRFTILGNKGNYKKMGLDPQEERMSQEMSPLDEGFAIEDAANSGILYTEENEEQILSVHGDYLGFYQKLSEAIQTKDFSKIPVTAESALEAIKIIEESIQSLE